MYFVSSFMPAFSWLMLDHSLLRVVNVLFGVMHSTRDVLLYFSSPSSCV